jgi:predicted component of type VI protein secretion system
MTTDKFSAEIEVLIRKALVRLLNRELRLDDPKGPVMEALMRGVAGHGLTASGDAALAADERDIEALIREAALNYEGGSRFTP